MSMTCDRIADFSADSPAISAEWFSVNDDVMGGRSLGAFDIEESALKFYGAINTNGGGFASIRHHLTADALLNADRIRLSVKTDGRAYTLTLRDKRADTLRIAHQAIIPTKPTQGFQPVDILFSELAPRFRGRSVNAEPFSPSEATSIGIMLSDGQDGEFEFYLAWIEACRPIN